MIGRLSEQQMDEMISTNNMGRIGCRDGEQIYIVPINYAFDGKDIIAHSVIGKKIYMMRKNPTVCFELDEITDNDNWRSVIASGVYLELTEERDRYDAMKIFVDKMLKLKISETAVPPEITPHRVHPRSPGNIKPVIFRIILLKKTGRYEKPAGES